MRNTRVLIVEDEGIVAMDIRNQLVMLGYTVTAVVPSGEEAIRKIEETQPDLVLMDIQIQGETDGVEVSEHVARQFDIPVVFLTANSDESTLQRAKVTGPFGYLLKPFESRELHTTIEMALYRHMLEQKLKKSEQWLATTLTSIGDAVIATDDTGRVNFINPVAEVLTGWRKEDAFGRNVTEVFRILNEQTGTVIEDPVTKALRLESVVLLQNRTVLISNDGKRIPIDDSAAPIRNDRDKTIGAVLVFRDITERRRAEEVIAQYQTKLEKQVGERTAELLTANQELQDENTRRKLTEQELKGSKKRFQDVALSSADWIWEVDTTGKYTYASGRVKEILGYDPDEIIGTTPFDLMSKEDAERIRRVFAKISSENKPIVDLENWNLTKEGRMVCLMTSGVPFLDENGDLLGYRGLDKDITERKLVEEHERELQEQLERAQRMESLGVLAGGVAHDLNNMLGPLVGYPELILRKLPNESPIRKQVQRMGKAAQDAADVVQDLLTLARRGRYKMLPVNLNDVVRDYLDSPSFVELAEQRSDIIISTILDNTVDNLRGSSPHLSKVVMNLIVNAFEAMSESGTLAIETEQKYINKLLRGYDKIESGEYILLRIRDTGMGIGPEELDKIFEPYYSKKIMGSSGSGLGLSVVYGVVKDHKGYYDIFSSVGEGTEFILYFPVSKKVVQEELDTTTNIEGEETILIVDDVEEQRVMASELLSSLGYRSKTASSGREAVSYLKGHSVDVVMLDMIMEDDFDGLDTYREIIKLHPEQKAVIVSGFSATDRVNQMQELGAGSYIKKPYSLDAIGRAIREELDRKHCQVRT